RFTCSFSFARPLLRTAPSLFPYTTLFRSLEQIIAYRFLLFIRAAGCKLQSDMDECIILGAVCDNIIAELNRPRPESGSRYDVTVTKQSLIHLFKKTGNIRFPFDVIRVFDIQMRHPRPPLYECVYERPVSMISPLLSITKPLR